MAVQLGPQCPLSVPLPAPEPPRQTPRLAPQGPRLQHQQQHHHYRQHHHHHHQPQQQHHHHLQQQHQQQQRQQHPQQHQPHPQHQPSQYQHSQQQNRNWPRQASGRKQHQHQQRQHYENQQLPLPNNQEQLQASQGNTASQCWQPQPPLVDQPCGGFNACGTKLSEGQPGPSGECIGDGGGPVPLGSRHQPQPQPQPPPQPPPQLLAQQHRAPHQRCNAQNAGIGGRWQGAALQNPTVAAVTPGYIPRVAPPLFRCSGNSGVQQAPIPLQSHAPPPAQYYHHQPTNAGRFPHGGLQYAPLSTSAPMVRQLGGYQPTPSQRFIANASQPPSLDNLPLRLPPAMPWPQPVPGLSVCQARLYSQASAPRVDEPASQATRDRQPAVAVDRANPTGLQNNVILEKQETSFAEIGAATGEQCNAKSVTAAIEPDGVATGSRIAAKGDDRKAAGANLAENPTGYKIVWNLEPQMDVSNALDSEHREDRNDAVNLKHQQDVKDSSGLEYKEDVKHFQNPECHGDVKDASNRGYQQDVDAVKPVPDGAEAELARGTRLTANPELALGGKPNRRPIVVKNDPPSEAASLVDTTNHRILSKSRKSKSNRRSPKGTACATHLASRSADKPPAAVPESPQHASAAVPDRVRKPAGHPEQPTTPVVGRNSTGKSATMAEPLLPSNSAGNSESAVTHKKSRKNKHNRRSPRRIVAERPEPGKTAGLKNLGSRQDSAVALGEKPESAAEVETAIAMPIERTSLAVSRRPDFPAKRRNRVHSERPFPPTTQEKPREVSPIESLSNTCSGGALTAEMNATNGPERMQAKLADAVESPSGTADIAVSVQQEQDIRVDQTPAKPTEVASEHSFPPVSSPTADIVHVTDNALTAIGELAPTMTETIQTSSTPKSPLDDAELRSQASVFPGRRSPRAKAKSKIERTVFAAEPKAAERKAVESQGAGGTNAEESVALMEKSVCGSNEEYIATTEKNAGKDAPETLVTDDTALSGAVRVAPPDADLVVAEETVPQRMLEAQETALATALTENPECETRPERFERIATTKSEKVSAKEPEPEVVVSNEAESEERSAEYHSDATRSAVANSESEVAAAPEPSQWTGAGMAPDPEVALSDLEAATAEEPGLEVAAAEETEPETVAATKPEPEIVASKTVEPKTIAAEPVTEIVAAKELEPDIDAAKKLEPEVVAAKELEPEIVAAKDSEPEIIVAKDPEPPIVAAKERELEIVAAKDPEPEIVAAEESELEVVAAKESERDIVAAKESEPQIVAAKESEPVTVVAKEAVLGIVSARESEPECAVAKESEPECVVAKESEPKCVVAKESEPKIATVKEPEPPLAFSESPGTSRLRLAAADKSDGEEARAGQEAGPFTANGKPADLLVADQESSNKTEMVAVWRQRNASEMPGPAELEASKESKGTKPETTVSNADHAPVELELPARHDVAGGQFWTAKPNSGQVRGASAYLVSGKSPSAAPPVPAPISAVPSGAKPPLPPSWPFAVFNTGALLNRPTAPSNGLPRAACERRRSSKPGELSLPPYQQESANHRPGGPSAPRNQESFEYGGKVVHKQDGRMMQLTDVWTLYYDARPPNKSQGFVGYESNLQEMCRFDNVTDFCKVINNVKRPSKLDQNSTLHLFKDGIKPMWEDKANEAGGRLTMLFPRAQLASRGGAFDSGLHNHQGDTAVTACDTAWTNLFLAAVGDQFDESICGIVAQRRPGGDRVSVWIPDCDSGKVQRIRDQVLRFADVKAEIEFRPHHAQRGAISVRAGAGR